MSETSDTSQAAADRLVEDLIERLNDGVVPVTDVADEGTRAVLREYIEILGVLPCELEPCQPEAAVKRRLMETLREPRIPVSANPRLRSRRWALPLAAGLAAALVGFVGWQSVTLQRQRQTIGQLADRLDAAHRQAAQLVDFREELERARAKLSLMTSRGVEVCALYPREVEIKGLTPRGTLFVTADHESWYLRIDGLEPCPEGRAYQLWFMKEDGTAETGGLLEVKSGVGLEVTSEALPAGTVAVSITLEPAGGSIQPSGPHVLYGDEVMRIL